MRAAIAPRVRWASTRCSSSSYRRALPSTMAAWLARAPSSSDAALSEGIGARRVGADGADRSLLADERRAHLRAVAGPGDPLVGARGVRERSVGRGSRRSTPRAGRRWPIPATPWPMLTVTSSGGGMSGLAPKMLLKSASLCVPARTWWMTTWSACQQPFRLVDRPQQDRRRVAQRGDRRGDLAQRALCLDLVRELVGRYLGLGVEQLRVGQHDRSLVGQQAQQLGGVGVECPRFLGVHADGADGAFRTDQRRRDDAPQPELPGDRVGGGVVRE